MTNRLRKGSVRTRSPDAGIRVFAGFYGASVNIEDVPDIAMMVLMGVVSGEQLVNRDGLLYLATGGQLLEFPVEVLDLLEDRHWLVVEHGSGVKPTPLGERAVAEWIESRFPDRPKPNMRHVRPAKLRAVRKGV